jgi:aryl-alcohol dehydrogenase-like predicted oxidoreductase
MKTRPLGRTGIEVSPLCLGTMTIASQVDEPTACSMIDMCLDWGVNFIDTANVYNAGKTEEILGNILAGRRDRFVLASKVGIKNDQLPSEGGLSRVAICTAIENTLRRLKTDYVDLYYLHQPDYSVPLEESLAAMDELVRAGKVRFIGASNYASWQLCRALWIAKDNGLTPVQFVQPMYNLLARGIEQELLPMCREFELAVVPYNPLAGGLLTGKHAQSGPAAGSRFDRMPLYRDRYWRPENFAAVERLSEVARAENRSLTQLAIGWLVERAGVASVILGASQLAHLEDNLSAIDKGPLSREAQAVCEEVWATLRGVSPVYNR